MGLNLTVIFTFVFLACNCVLTAVMCTELGPGSLVWAKTAFFPAWPAKVVQPPPGVRINPDSLYVFFYGSKDFGWVKKKYIFPYKEFYSRKFKQHNKDPQYAEAVKQIGEVYHEQEQLRSPTFQRIQLDENGEEAIDTDSEKESDYEVALKYPRYQLAKKGSQEKMLKVKPLGQKRHRKNILQKTANKRVKYDSPCRSSSSSRILTVQVCDYKKVVPKQVFVLLKRLHSDFSTFRSKEMKDEACQFPTDESSESEGEFDKKSKSEADKGAESSSPADKASESDGQAYGSLESQCPPAEPPHLQCPANNNFHFHSAAYKSPIWLPEP